MFEDIDPRSPTPLYEQIARRIRVAIAAGELRPDDVLPSVRKLAAELRLNPATVVQAYRDLEQEGFVARRQGSGTYVRDMSGPRRQGERRAQAQRLVRELLEKSARLGVPVEEVREALLAELEVEAS